MTTTQKAIEAYDHKRCGPILGVSDEGGAAPTIVDAAYDSAKALAVENPDALTVGVIIDGERMGSAGEVPVGPEEYALFFPPSKDSIFCTTNVGVRVNTRIHQPYRNSRSPTLPTTKRRGSTPCSQNSTRSFIRRTTSRGL